MTAIIIGGEKGGTGKSTIATNLAIMASIMGKDVLLLDTDKQGSSANFITQRNDKGFSPTPLCVQRGGNHLHKELEDLHRKYEVIIVDVGGRDSVELRAAMASKVVKKMYTPLKPSNFDMETLKQMDDVASMIHSINPDLEVNLIFNQTPTHAKITLFEEALKDSNESLDYITPLNLSLSNRIPFVYAAGDCLSVVEFEYNHIKNMPTYRANSYNPKASIEICSLYEHAFDHKFTGPITKYFEKKKEIINEE